MQQAPYPDLGRLKRSSRAARMITALSHPDLAALLAGLPRRSGQDATLTDLKTATGLDVKALANAVSRGNNAGVLTSPAPGRIAVDTKSIAGMVAELVGENPVADLAAGHPQLEPWLRWGRIEELPGDRPDLMARLCGMLASLFEADRDYAEPEVNQILQLAGDDYAALRRELVERGTLRREPDGSHYRVAG